MAKPKRKLTAAEKRIRAERKRNFMTIFIHGKQKRVPRPLLIDGLELDEFLANNADPLWLHQNEMWECIPSDEMPFPNPSEPGDTGILENSNVTHDWNAGSNAG